MMINRVVNDDLSLLIMDSNETIFSIISDVPKATKDNVATPRIFQILVVICPTFAYLERTILTILASR